MFSKLFPILRHYRSILLSGAVLTCSVVAQASIAEVIDGEELMDPTRPFFADGVNTDDSSVLEMIRNVIPASYDLTFVRMSGESSIAVINNQRVRIGDVIGGALVVGIDRSGVTLRINDEERRVEMYGTSIKRPLVER